MRQTFRERAETVRVTSARGHTTVTRQVVCGESTTAWHDGATTYDHRSQWTDEGDQTVELPDACRTWLDRSRPDVVVRLLAIRRAISVTDLAEPNRRREDTRVRVTIMIDGPGLRGRDRLVGDLADVTADRLAALTEAAVVPQADPWPWPSAVTLPVVFAAGVGGTAFHEVVGHGMEAELGVPAPQPGTRLGAEAITVVDDATLPGLWGSARIDDQGVPTRPITLVRRGVVTGALHERSTSAESSSARRMDYRSRPLARMSTTFLAPGDDDTAALFDGPTVLHCVEGGSAEIRPGSRDVAMRIRRAELWRAGEPVSAHRGLALHFTSEDVLHGIDGVGADLRFEPGRCAKESQSVPVAHGAPTFRIARARVTGASE